MQAKRCFRAIPAAVILIALAVLILFVPAGEVLPAARNAYYIGEGLPPYRFGARMYGLVLAIGAAVACFRLLTEAGKQGLRFSALALALGLLCSRLLFCLVCLNLYMPETGGAGSALRLFDGGLSVLGGYLGALLAVWIGRRSPRAQEERSGLAFALPVIVCFARFAEEWSGGGLGMSVDTAGVFAVAERFGAKLCVRRIELLAAALIYIALLVYRAKKRLSGSRLLAASCFLFGALQLLLESLRADRHMIWGFVKAEQVLSLLLSTGALLWALKGDRRRQAFSVLAGVLVAGVVFGLEKALDRLNVSALLLYAIFAILIVGYIVFGYRMTHQKEE